jgi:hypothetical protein
MKALSVHPEPAHAILAGKKTREYRKWATSYRGPLVIHSTKPDGFLLCLVDLVDCMPRRNGGFAWVLVNVRPLKRVKAKGQLGLWNVKDSLVQLA